MSRQRLPLPDWAPPWWVGVLFLAGWVVGLFLGLLIGAPPPLVMFIGIQSWQVPVVGVVMLILSLWQQVRWAQRAANARALGLPFRPRVYEDDLAPYRHFTLFAITRDCRRWAGYLHEGWFDGHEVVFFDYGFVGKFRSTDDRTVSWPGRQTVFLLPDAAGVPDFHFAPSDSDWADLVEARLWSLDAGDAVLEVEMDDAPPAILRGKDERAIKRLFRQRQREDMGLAPGWTIECYRGTLMFYRDRKVLRPEELPRYLNQVIRIAEVLRAVSRSLPPVSTGAPLPPLDRPDHIVQPGDNVRPPAPDGDPS